MTRGNVALALLLMLPLPAAAKEPDIHGHWSGTFRSKHFHIAPFTIGMDIDAAEAPGHRGRKLGRLSKNSGPTYCLSGDVSLKVERAGSNVVIAGTNGTGDTISMVGTLDPAGSVMTLNYVTNGSISGKCESDDGTVTLTKK